MASAATAFAFTLAVALGFACPAAAATCFRATPTFDEGEVDGVKVVRRDLIGQTFWLTRYSQSLMRKTTKRTIRWGPGETSSSN